MPEFENYLEERIEVLEAAPSGVPVPNSWISIDVKAGQVADGSDLHWSDVNAGLVGTDLRRNPGDDTLIDVLTEGDYAFMFTAVFDCSVDADGAVNVGFVSKGNVNAVLAVLPTIAQYAVAPGKQLWLPLTYPPVHCLVGEQFVGQIYANLSAGTVTPTAMSSNIYVKRTA